MDVSLLNFAVVSPQEAGQTLNAAAAAGSSAPNIRVKAKDYISRAEQLRNKSGTACLIDI